MQNPKVTIIIPCFNTERYIEASLLSALNQNYDNIEVIFVDNESTDRSVEIAKKVQERYPELIMSSAANVYPNCWDEPRDAGLKLMTGDYVLTMGADDYINTHYIKNCMKIISLNPDEIKALQSPIRGLRENTGIVFNEIKYEYHSLSEFKKSSLEGCPVNTPTVIFSASLYRDGLLKTSPEIYGGAADYDLYCRLADHGIVIHTSSEWLGFYYRWHPDQATWKVAEEGINYDKMIQDYWSAKWKT